MYIWPNMANGHIDNSKMAMMNPNVCEIGCTMVVKYSFQVADVQLVAHERPNRTSSKLMSGQTECFGALGAE